MSYSLVARSGSEFSAAERAAFINLVIGDSEVQQYTLRANVPLAPSLIFLRQDGRRWSGRVEKSIHRLSRELPQQNRH
jgi:hypothetical protein